MKKPFLLIFAVFNCKLIYATFPVIESINILQTALPLASDINTGEKIIWFLLGMTFYGIGVAIIYQLITKKKGPIKFSIFGFIAIILFFVLLFLGLDVVFENPFVFG